MKINKNLYPYVAMALLLSWCWQGAMAAESTMSGSYLAGRFAKNNGDGNTAIADLERVHREEPENKGVASQLQDMLLMQGRMDDAVKLAQDIRMLDEKDVLSDLLLALREIKANQLQAASGLLNSAAENSSAQLWQPLISAWIDSGLHKLTKPMTLEGLSADISRAVPLANYHLALINAQAGFVDAAAANFKNTIEDPKNPPSRAIKLLLRFYEQNNSPAILTPVVEAYRQSHPDSALEKDVPAITTVQEGAAEVLYTMGGIMLGADAGGDAVVYLQMALYLKPDFAEAAMALGDAYADLQQYAPANGAYGRIMPGSIFYERAQLHIAADYDHMGKLNESVAMLDTMAKNAPGNPDALVIKGDLLRMHGRYKDAVAAYTQGLNRIKEPKSIHWPILFARGACLERLGKWAEAEQDMQRALALMPDQPDVLNYLAYGWLERGRHVAEARSMIEKAVKARPDDAQIVDSMGWALYLSGDYEGAAEYLEKAVELLPGDATVNDHLGDVYWRLGHKTEARYQWERSLGCSPDTKMADSLHKKLKDGLPPPATLADTAPAQTSDASPVTITP